jgi:hypothetical protein
MENRICTHCNEENKHNAKYCMYCGYEIPGFKPTQEPKTEGAEKQKTSNKRRWVTITVTVVAFIVTYFAAQSLVQTLFAFDKIMMKMASELNEACPIMADSDTRLDNAVALPGNCFQYNFTLVNLTKSEINIEEFEAYMRPQITNNIKTNPDMLVFCKNLVTLVYSYKDKDAQHVTKITVTPQQYKE